MPFDPEKILAMEPIIVRQTLTKRDTILYALGVGADELAYVYEEGLSALPTMAVVMAYPGFLWQKPELGIDWKRVLHGEQFTELHVPLPVKAMLRSETKIEAIYDKGAAKGSIAHVVRRIIDEETNTLLATTTTNTFLRGNGGHGGSQGKPPAPHLVPDDRAPDEVITLTTTHNQAAVYRLSGDYNPLHIDPEVAKAAGFDRPILHGLCTYGVAGRALLKALCDNNPARLRRMDARFSSPVYPGETIATEIWHEGDGRAAFRSKVTERDVIVLTHGYAEFL